MREFELTDPAGLEKRVKVGNVIMQNDDGMMVINPSTGRTTIHLTIDGDAIFGEDVERPGMVSFAIFSRDQKYNGEAMGQGDVLFGDNSSEQANLLWRRNTGKLIFRYGQVEAMYVKPAQGIALKAGSSSYNSIMWENAAGTEQGHIHGIEPSTLHLNAYTITLWNTTDAQFTVDGAGTISATAIEIHLHPDGQIIMGSATHYTAVDADGIFSLEDGVTAPGTTSGRAKIYVDTADGDLKVKFGDGTIKTIVTDT